MKVLVPLVDGKSADLLWIWRRGHETFGLERMPSLISEFAAEINPILDANNNISLESCDAVADRLMHILQTRLSEPVAEHSFHVVWDAALSYCKPELRPLFVQCIRRLMKFVGFKYFLVALELAQPEFQSETKGPFQLPQHEVYSLFSSFAQIKRITPTSALSSPKTFPFTEVLYLITSN